MHPDILTTGRIAKRCGVSVGTVKKWIDKGILKGYTLPGGKARRVTNNEFMKFITNYNITIDAT